MAQRLRREPAAAAPRQRQARGAASAPEFELLDWAFISAARNDALTLEALLQRGLAADSRDASGESLLDRAIRCGSREAAAVLWARGAETAADA